MDAIHDVNQQLKRNIDRILAALGLLTAVTVPWSAVTVPVTLASAAVVYLSFKALSSFIFN